VLFLWGNVLSGSIPPSLGNCSEIYVLDLSRILRELAAMAAPRRRRHTPRPTLFFVVVVAIIFSNFMTALKISIYKVIIWLLHENDEVETNSIFFNLSC
jgi:hypothetical protein